MIIMRDLPTTDALILAGGFGTRLRSVVSDLPKPMAPINGLPFLSYLLSRLQKQGIKRVFISLHYLPQAVINYYGEKFLDMELHYIIEPSPLGTGGAILFCLNKINSDKPIFILNGDTYVDFSLIDLAASATNALLAVALTKIENSKRYNRVLVEDQDISAFNADEEVSNLINAGVYFASVELKNELAKIKKSCFSLENDFLSVFCEKYKIAACVFEGFFIDIGIPEDYFRFQLIKESL